MADMVAVDGVGVAEVAVGVAEGFADRYRADASDSRRLVLGIWDHLQVCVQLNFCEFKGEFE